MNKGLFFFCLAACAHLALEAQTVRMINSSVQNWSGGIAGRHGANYAFSVEFSDFSTEPVPDTLWIENEPFGLLVLDSTITYGNVKRTRTKRTVRYEFGANTYHDDYAEHNAPPPFANEPKKTQPHPPIEYKEAGLLSYKYQGKEHYYTISKIMTVFPPANYP